MRDLLILFGAVGLLFLGVRKFWWWYLGIDRMIVALESIDQSLKCLPGVKSERQRRVA